MGNAVKGAMVNEDDRFFSGDVPTFKKMSPGSDTRGRVLSLKVTAPRKASQSQSTKHKFATFSCRVVSKETGLVLCGRPHFQHEIPFVSSADIASQYEETTGSTLCRLTIPDSRASQILLIPQPRLQKWWIVPARQPFTRHSGTCRVIGDRNMPGTPQTIKTGDFLRLGSVGLLVTETHNGTNHIALSDHELQELAMEKKDFLEELYNGEAATLTKFNKHRSRNSNNPMNDNNLKTFRMADEQDSDDQNMEMDVNASFNTDTWAPGSPNDPDMNVFDDEETLPPPSLCYICFDSDDTEENPLVAPCNCRGSTKFVHMECLQHWNTSKEVNRPCVVSNKKGAQVCGVCKAPYKTHLRLGNGKFVPLLKPNLKPPFISFTVCTRHQHQEELFSTRFHLSFSSIMRTNNTSSRQIIIGRSQASDMVLDYRTVSTKHAAVNFLNGEFSIQDLKSSNGSFIYVKEPLALSWGESISLRWGRGCVTIKASKSSGSCMPIGMCSGLNAVQTVDSNIPDAELSLDLLRNLASSLPMTQRSLINKLVLRGSLLNPSLNQELVNRNICDPRLMDVKDDTNDSTNVLALNVVNMEDERHANLNEA